MSRFFRESAHFFLGIRHDSFDKINTSFPGGKADDGNQPFFLIRLTPRNHSLIRKVAVVTHWLDSHLKIILILSR